MYCIECGEKLQLVFRADEGLVPFCQKCNEYRFAQAYSAVSMVPFNRTKDRILLAKNAGEDDFVLFAGYIKKGETAEKTVSREFKEETKLNVVKFRYTYSRYVESKNVLMFNYIIIAENGDAVINPAELEEVRWFTFDEALEAIRPGSTAEYFLKNAIQEVQRGVI
ncbi:MAG: NUDIX domain-containing protein [Clostridia bacterium]|nr:NUDIX domain-containing protein [Clostridia bacterium]